MKRLTHILFLLFITLIPLTSMAEESSKGKGEINISEMVLEHLSDSYEWHITTVAGKPISIPLPIILVSDCTGKFTVCTAETLPAPYYFDEAHHGKIYEKASDGTSVRPWDFSITKSVAQIWIVVFILIAVFVSISRWYKKRDKTSAAPGGFVGVMETLVMYIYDDVVKINLGEERAKQYGPYLLTVFFFILTTNLLGLLPVFPGGANVTGNINVTFLLAFCTMVLINFFGNKEYWLDIFWPKVPFFLKAYPLPLIPVIEFVGIITKPFALMVRLFANMMAGHAILLSFTFMIFLGWSLGVGMGIGLNTFGILMLLFMNCVELLVAFIQAYVFTLLSAVFISLAHQVVHEE